MMINEIDLDTKERLKEAISYLSMIEASIIRADLTNNEYGPYEIIEDVQVIKNMLILTGMDLNRGT